MGWATHRLTAETFWDRTRRAGDCILWTLGADKRGYGRVSFQGRKRRAHQVAWEITNGPIPAGLWLLHSCDNPACCNPEHLRLGDHEQNMRDMRERGRSPKGSANPQSKLTDSSIAEIRRLYSSGQMQKDIAKLFQISKSAVSLICLRRTWSHV